jgi:hypothetical protein
VSNEENERKMYLKSDVHFSCSKFEPFSKKEQDQFCDLLKEFVH